MTKIHSATTLIIAMSFSLWSLSSHALTMEQAWTAAKATNPDYKIKQLQQTQNQFDTGIARSVLLPDLSTTASKTWADHDQNSTPGYTITLSQSIWDSRSWVELDQAQAQVVYAQLDVKKNRIVSLIMLLMLILKSLKHKFQLISRMNNIKMHYIY